MAGLRNGDDQRDEMEVSACMAVFLTLKARLDTPSRSGGVWTSISD